jgi:hypothetical protein
MFLNKHSYIDDNICSFVTVLTVWGFNDHPPTSLIVNTCYLNTLHVRVLGAMQFLSRSLQCFLFEASDQSLSQIDRLTRSGTRV